MFSAVLCNYLSFSIYTFRAESSIYCPRHCKLPQAVTLCDPNYSKTRGIKIAPMVLLNYRYTSLRLLRPPYTERT